MSGGRGYKRSWKNLLINTQYQLSFTFIMVGLAAVLMGLLGWWVVRVASEATTVGKSALRGKPCPPSPAVTADAPEPPDEAAAPAAPAAPSPAAAPVAPSATPPAAVADPPGAAPSPPPAVAAPPAAPAAAEPLPPDEDAGPRRRVVIESSSMTIEEPTAPPPPPVVVNAEFVAQVAAHWTCELEIAGALAAADRRFDRIVWVMIGSSVLLILGLAVMGIKMTHKVAGPLYKVTLYLAKMRDGRYDKVYDLRKGDQLVEFYEHFKHAHAGVVAMEKADLATITAALEAAKASGALETSSDLAAAAAALRDVAARKEKSLGG